jgi:RNA polymerase sigma-70 factor (ECF subfamily)
MQATVAELMGVMRQNAAGGAPPERTAGVLPFAKRASTATASSAAPSTKDETSLIEAVQAGDSAAFDELAERHMRRALAVAYRLLGQRQDAEDIVQDSFLAALVKIDTFERGRPFGPWLFRIVANRAINLRKARALRQAEPLPATAASRDESPADAAERGERKRALQQALLQLPEQQRWIVELFEIDGFTSPEIADMLDLADGTVRWHLHAARQTLRTVLGRFALRTP